MDTHEIRWEQRFSNFLKALQKMEEAVLKLKEKYPLDEKGRVDEDNFLDDIIKEGLIQRFEYTHELAWKVMKDFFLHAGNTNIFGSKDATREAFAAGLISNGEIWMDMIQSRNKTLHTYNKATADEIFQKVINPYFEEFVRFRDRMKKLQISNQK